MPSAQARHVLQHLRQAVSPGDDAGDGQLLELFLNHRDEMAFAILLRRHGPMVWGVCHRIAGQVPDAEDAFQAVFLILVRNAERIWPRDRIGAWLHGVAYRTAHKARQLADRRRSHEKQLATFPHPTVEALLPNGDLNPILDEELSRLPEKFRMPVLLCDLEGRSQRDVARELQLPVGTLCHRLASARRVLARRLTRRGVTLAVGAASVITLPRSLAAVTRRAGLALAAGRELASLVPPQIVALTEGVTLMTSSKFRLTAVLVFLFVLGGLGLGARHLPALAAGENDSPQARPSPPKSSETQSDDRTFLRRLSMDLRGMLPTDVEMNYFLDDRDAGKRRKVATWMLADIDSSTGKPQPGRSPERSAAIDAYRKLADEWVRKSVNNQPDQKNKLSDTQAALEGYLRALKAADQPHTAGADDAAQDEELLKRAAEHLRRLKELQKSSGEQTAPSPNSKTPDQAPDAYRKAFEEYYRRLQKHEKDSSENAEDAKRTADRLAEYEKQFEKADKNAADPFADIPYLRDLFKKVQDTKPLDEKQAKQVVEELQRLLDSKQKQTRNLADPDRQKKLLEELQRAIESLNQKRSKPADSPDSRLIQEQIRRGLDLLIEQEMDEQLKTARLRLAGNLTKGSDPEYLRRIMLDLTGKLPTMVEMNYFLADKDANKRTKIVDWVVKSSPEAAKRWAEQQRAETRQKRLETLREYAAKRSQVGSTPAHFGRLLDELLNGSRSDEQILEALTLATLARFPTESERLFLTGFMKSQSDRRKAWEQVLSVQLSTNEFRQHLDALNHQVASRKSPSTAKEEKQ